MQDDDAMVPPAGSDSGDAPPSRLRGAISVALLVGVGCMPLVIAAGFLADGRGRAAVPGDIDVAALRGVLEGGALRPAPPTRAGF